MTAVLCGCVDRRGSINQKVNIMLGTVWDVLWWIFLFYIFFAYLMVLFSIVGDLFRDKDVSGWLKAVWILCLIFFPFITLLVYLITRGKGMAERSQEQMLKQKSATDTYIREVAASASPAEEIAKAKGLLDSGAISAEEYAAIKAKALA